MSGPLESATAIHRRVLAHLLARIRAATVCDEPFTHTCLHDMFPADIYVAFLANLPPADQYGTGPDGPRTRTFYNLTAGGVRRLPDGGRRVWSGVAAALTDPELKRGLYAKLAPDLMHRFGVKEGRVHELAGHARPTLYRDVEGFELPPHPDTPKKVVTMHLYLPADLSQIYLGTALYRRTPGSSDAGDRFTAAKMVEFRPNSGYAFVVNNSGTRQSWHGREPLPAGAGVRNSLLNTFYSEPRQGYADYLQDG